MNPPGTPCVLEGLCETAAVKYRIGAVAPDDESGAIALFTAG